MITGRDGIPQGEASLEFINDRISERKLTGGLLLVLLLFPLVASSFMLFLGTQYLLFALFALSVGLLWGYAGILSIGHAAFFGFGAYIMAWSFQYISVVNPAYAAFVLTPVVIGLFAGIIGYSLFYSDVRDVYFVIITISITVIFELLAVSLSDLTGGFEGMFLDRMSITVFGIPYALALTNDRLFYYVVLFAFLAGFLVCSRIVRSDFGEVLIAIRENEDRTRSLGYDTPRYKTLVFSFSAVLAGIAGALFATFTQFVSPPLTGILLSTEVVIWTAVGGRKLLVGAVVGAVFIKAAATLLSGIVVGRQMLVLGILFIAVVVWFPDGIVGHLSKKLDLDLV